MNTTRETIAPSTLLARGRRGVDRYGGRRALTREIAMRALRPVLAPVAARRLAGRASRAVTVDEVLDLAYTFEAFGITVRPCQSRWELRHLLEEVSELRPRAMLEIGTATGGSLMAFAGVCATDAHVISVDLPHGAFGGGYPLWKVPLYKSFARETQRLDLIRGDSHSSGTFDDVEARLNGQKLDFLFIDGDHTYEGVKQDFERYKSLVRPRGLIGFHDVCPPYADSSVLDDPGDVPRFWEELKLEYDAHEFIEPDGAGCFGIGVVSS
jgi:predicted O-methyltransferase YrrM